jgi:hypothetical protein
MAPAVGRERYPPDLAALCYGWRGWPMAGTGRAQPEPRWPGMATDRDGQARSIAAVIPKVGTGRTRLEHRRAGHGKAP